MCDARRIREDDGRPVVCLGLLEGLEGLVAVVAESDAGDVHVSVAHAHEAHVLLVGALAAGRELGDRRGGRCLGGLAAGVRVDLGVQHQDVHVAVHGDHVVDAAVSDVVCPAVSADDPDRLVGEVVGEFIDLCQVLAVALCGVLGDERLCGVLCGDGLVVLGVVPELEGVSDGVLEVCGGLVAGEDLLGVCLESLAVRIDGEAHSETELRVVLEEGVCPCGAASALALGVWDGRECSGVD